MLCVDNTDGESSRENKRDWPEKSNSDSLFFDQSGRVRKGLGVSILMIIFQLIFI